jgi:hypothetical protein
MTWNHRVISREGQDELAIHEVYYDEDGEPNMVTNDAVGIYGETVEELRETLERMLKSLEAPKLAFESFGQPVEGR